MHAEAARGSDLAACNRCARDRGVAGRFRAVCQISRLWRGRVGPRPCRPVNLSRPFNSISIALPTVGSAAAAAIALPARTGPEIPICIATRVKQQHTGEGQVYPVHFWAVNGLWSVFYSRLGPVGRRQGQGGTRAPQDDGRGEGFSCSKVAGGGQQAACRVGSVGDCEQGCIRGWGASLLGRVRQQARAAQTRPPPTARPTMTMATTIIRTTSSRRPRPLMTTTSNVILMSATASPRTTPMAARHRLAESIGRTTSRPSSTTRINSTERTRQAASWRRTSRQSSRGCSPRSEVMPNGSRRRGCWTCCGGRGRGSGRGSGRGGGACLAECAAVHTSRQRCRKPGGEHVCHTSR